MQRVDVHKVPMNSPDDTSGLEALVDSGELDPQRVVALVGKTEGNGLVNDFSRGFAELAFKIFFSEALNISRSEVADRISMVMSGGCPGLMSPHVTVFAREDADVDTGNGTEKRLAIGIAHSDEILPEELGRMAQIRKVAAATRAAMEVADIVDPGDVHFVQVKTPLLNIARMREAEARGRTVVTHDTFTSMLYANDASALGVGLATGEIPEEKLGDDVVRRDYTLYSSVASASSGGEKTRAEVVVLGNSASAVSRFRIGHSVMRDLIDADGVREALRSAGLEFDYQPSDEQLQR